MLLIKGIGKRLYYPVTMSAELFFKIVPKILLRTWDRSIRRLEVYRLRDTYCYNGRYDSLTKGGYYWIK